jgi:flagella basal body P-ring formation protein FlgA
MTPFRAVILPALLCAAPWVALDAPRAQEAMPVEQMWKAEDIRQFVRIWMEGNGKPLADNVFIGPLDERIRVPACDTTPTLAARSARSTVHVVRCPGSKPWELTLRIGEDERPAPVQLATALHPRAPGDGWPVVVPRVNLPAGTILAADQLELRMVETSPGTTVFKSIGEATGLRLTASVGPGQILSTRAVAKAPHILKGENVIIVSSGAGFEISAPGKAEADGYEGDLVPAKNSNSGVIVTGKLGPGGVITVR